jgi:hypothetical protein
MALPGVERYCGLGATRLGAELSAGAAAVLEKGLPSLGPIA